MIDSLAELLKNRLPDEPSEFPVIRSFVAKQFNVVPKLSISRKNIIIAVPGAAVAGSLQLQLYELQALCKTDCRLVVRIAR